ncbi:hypothetical protein AXG93_2891s1080 [Marchantia polymorpha subsp. ruderalis]|uniref:Uncharacterized protein n=1 Tax=Marchantia polymorpha subsp. ruderalis TaxID=1480154 RepID=A0A176WNP0_MARPO|nr:hypothetical protein AXG93_2891s1080 [Marchantia polymorpha subsp. ruderalis]
MSMLQTPPKPLQPPPLSPIQREQMLQARKPPSPTAEEYHRAYRFGSPVVHGSATASSSSSSKSTSTSTSLTTVDMNQVQYGSGVNGGRAWGFQLLHKNPAGPNPIGNEFRPGNSKTVAKKNRYPPPYGGTVQQDEDEDDDDDDEEEEEEEEGEEEIDAHDLSSMGRIDDRSNSVAVDGGGEEEEEEEEGWGGRMRMGGWGWRWRWRMGRPGHKPSGWDNYVRVVVVSAAAAAVVVVDRGGGAQRVIKLLISHLAICSLWGRLSLPPLLLLLLATAARYSSPSP